MSVLERLNLKGKKVLVTGAGGLFGMGLARAVAEAGATLVVASRDEGKMEALASELRGEGFDAFAEVVNQGNPGSIEALGERIEGRFGVLDGLVNNAVLRPMKGADGSVEQWEESMRVNATGLMLMHRVFGQQMVREECGSIVNIGSIQGMMGPSYELYAGTTMGDLPPDYWFHKGGMLSLTRFYAGLFGKSGVRVNCVSPGGFFNDQPRAFVERYSEHTMLGRMADDRDLGGAVVYLLSDASTYVTGVNLPVDGGYTAK